MTPPFTGPFNAEYASDNGTAFVVDSCGNPVPPEWIAARLNAAAPAPSVAQSEREAFEACATEARRYASYYKEASDGRNTFTLLAEWCDRQATVGDRS